jgi:hypothetical protein
MKGLPGKKARPFHKCSKKPDWKRSESAFDGLFTVVVLGGRTSREKGGEEVVGKKTENKRGLTIEAYVVIGRRGILSSRVTHRDAAGYHRDDGRESRDVVVLETSLEISSGRNFRNYFVPV